MTATSDFLVGTAKLLPPNVLLPEGYASIAIVPPPGRTRVPDGARLFDNAPVYVARNAFMQYPCVGGTIQQDMLVAFQISVDPEETGCNGYAAMSLTPFGN